MLRYFTNIPNLITLCSMFCGFYAICLTAGAEAGDTNSLYRAAIAIVLATIFDGLDGRVARMTGTGTEFGVQLDSLSDLISFGVAPAFLMYRWGLHELGAVGMFISFLFLACGAMRLARFNITVTEIPKGFSQGLTITQCAGMIAAAVMFNYRVLGGELHNVNFLAACSIGLSFVMVSDIWFRTFKDLKMNRRGLTFMLVLFGSMTLMMLRTREFSYIFLFYPLLHVVTGVIEDLLRYVRGQTHAHLIAEHHAALIADDPDEEAEERLVLP